jgi:ADP-ribosyl-[dinitrogen reductase] hydrolase
MRSKIWPGDRKRGGVKIMNPDSSVISPLRINAVEVPGTTGLIGMAECPGKNEYTGFGIPAGPWRRHLDMDLRVILDWQARILVSLIEDHEFELLDVPELPGKTRNLGIGWLHLPVADGCIPDSRLEKAWDTAGKELRQVLTDGGRIVLHCRRGLGRSGTIAARLLVEFGMTPCAAFAAVRHALPGAIQTGEQEDYVRRCRRGLKF